jgi:hypothetical protein
MGDSTERAANRGAPIGEEVFPVVLSIDLLRSSQEIIKIVAALEKALAEGKVWSDEFQRLFDCELSMSEKTCLQLLCLLVADYRQLCFAALLPLIEMQTEQHLRHSDTPKLDAVIATCKPHQLAGLELERTLHRSVVELLAALQKFAFVCVTIELSSSSPLD